MRSPPRASRYVILYVCVCKCFACNPSLSRAPRRYISLFPSLSPVRVRAPERHQSLSGHYNFAFQFVGRKCQGGPRCGCVRGERPEGKEEARGEGGGDRRAWGHRLGTGYRHGARPCQRRVTLSYRDTQARAAAAAAAVGDVAASGGDAGRTFLPLHCLLVVRRTDRQDGAQKKLQTVKKPRWKHGVYFKWYLT